MTSPASDTFQIQPTSVRAGQTATLSGQGCTEPGARASTAPTVFFGLIGVATPDSSGQAAVILVHGVSEATR